MERARRRHSERRRQSLDKLHASKYGTLPLASYCHQTCPPPLRERHVRERLSLESSLEFMKDKLQSAEKQLDYEGRWRDSADGTHKRLLKEKSALQSE